MTQGIVVKSTGSWYTVKTDDGRFLDCKVKGVFRLRGIRSTNPVAVGDCVRVTVGQDNSAYIKEVEPRRNYIVRRASNLSKESHIIAANIDLAMLVITIEHPRTNLIFVDRLLATPAAYGVPATIVITPSVLYERDVLEYDLGAQ